MRSATVSSLGAELHYVTHGAGPVCLIPSLIGTAPYVRMTAAALGGRLRPAYVDLRGGGKSTGRAVGLTFDTLAADLEAVRTDIGVERVAVLGHSVLGILAVEYGLRCPDAVSNVIVVGTPPAWDPPRLAAESGSFFEADASDERKAVFRRNLADLPRDPSPGQSVLAQTPMRFFDPNFDAAPLFAEAELRPELLQHVMGVLAGGWDVRSRASSLRVPMLVAHGRYDYTVPYRLWEGVVDTLPATTLRLFDCSGHQPFFEEPDVFGATIEEWMARAGKPST